jgi:hypothetical protein
LITHTWYGAAQGRRFGSRIHGRSNVVGLFAECCAVLVHEHADQQLGRPRIRMGREPAHRGDPDLARLRDQAVGQRR